MKKKKLNQSRRIIVAGLYLVIIIVIYYVFEGDIYGLINQNGREMIWFYSGILLVIIGRYVSEPYFASPSDTFINSLSVILLLIGLTDRYKFLGYYLLLYYSVCIFILSLVNMLFKDSNECLNKITFSIIKCGGKSEIMFSAVYMLSVFSYFKEKYEMLIVAIFLWILIVHFDLLSSIVNMVCEWLNVLIENKSGYIGVAIQNLEYQHYTIEVFKTEKNRRLLDSISKDIYIIKTGIDLYSLGCEVERKNLIESIWINLFLLEKTYEYDLNTLKSWGLVINENEQIGTTYVLSLSDLPKDVKSNIEKSKIFNERVNLIGFILQDSNLNTIRFRLCKLEKIIKEGDIVETTIFDDKVFYQVINGITSIESNGAGSDSIFITVVARKIGKYENNELKVANWVPKTWEPVYTYVVNNDMDLKNVAKVAIGRLPSSDMLVPIKDINTLVTHSTAVLGVLGVGKSCLTFELIKKIVENDTKIICLDITNQYNTPEGLAGYLNEDIIQNDFAEMIIELDSKANNKGGDSNPKEWGNIDNYKEKLSDNIKRFMNDSSKKVLILNPDNHKVTKAGSQFKISYCTNVSLVEKVELISESILAQCMNMGQTSNARCCIIYEEAHSLIPESNSVVVKEDSNHVNGTAKVILQGRKYGLGCIVVTQRTANVTKSILTQCNTIMALRVFDETGKVFLENYVGKDYSDILPTLEERQALVIGKGLCLKQPVIIQLNDTKYVKKQ